MDLNKPASSCENEILATVVMPNSQSNAIGWKRSSLKLDDLAVNGLRNRQPKRRKSSVDNGNHTLDAFTVKIRSSVEVSSAKNFSVNNEATSLDPKTKSISAKSAQLSIQLAHKLPPALINNVKSRRWSRNLKSSLQYNGPSSCNISAAGNDEFQCGLNCVTTASYEEQKMWTDQYLPTSLSEMIVRSNELAFLVSWMKSWNSRVKKAINKKSYRSSPMKHARFKKSNQAYFYSSTDSTDSPSSESFSSWRRSAYLILGPTGCGKTSLVYALASQFGYKVFELNPSSCRSGKEVTSVCSSVMASHHVSTEALSSTSSTSVLLKDTEGLKINNRSLILFDEVDILFDTDRGFWHAVGKLLQMGRRPIFLTASEPSVIRKISVPFQTCNLLPLTSHILIKPILQRICDSRGLCLTDSLMLALTRSENEERNYDVSGCIASTAEELVSNQEFSNIRRSIVRLQWIMGSGDHCTDKETLVTSSHDLVSAYINAFHRLFSLSFTLPHTPSIDRLKSTKDEFVGVFVSDIEDEPSFVLDEQEKQAKPSTVVRLPLAQCKEVSADLLSELSRLTDMQALLDMCSTVSGRSEIARGIESLPLNIASSDFLNVFGDVCSAPLSGVDPVGIIGTFACEEEWRRVLDSTISQNLTRIEGQLLAFPASSQDSDYGFYVNEHSANDSFSSAIFNKAAGTLDSLKAFNAVKRYGNSSFQRESALDYLPALRNICRAELNRKNLANRRRFFHYFDQIGLHLSEAIRTFLSQ